MSSVYSKLIYNRFMETVGNWLENKYLDWQKEQGHRCTLDEFAEYLGFTRPYISMLMNKARKKISLKAVEQIAERTGDMSIYDAAGYLRPDGSLLPPGLKSALDGAIDEIEREYKSRGVTDLSSPEALEIAKRIMSEHGFTVTL